MLEMLMALVVLAVLVGLGAPQLMSLVHSSRLPATSNELVAALHLARAEAVRRNRPVVLCRSANQASCATGSEWPGWLLFVDTDADSVLDTGEDIVRTGVVEPGLVLRASSNISTRNDRLRFAPSGRAIAADELTMLNATLRVCAATTQPAQNVRDVTLAAGTRVATVPRNTGGDCTTAPGN
jgi:type IV fimbrial biogenesis protein FimT